MEKLNNTVSILPAIELLGQSFDGNDVISINLVGNTTEISNVYAR